MSVDDPAAVDVDRNALLAALLSRVALGDERSFEEVYRQTGAHLYAVALRIVRDRAIAEEIVQEAFVSVWHHAGTYDASKAAPLTWLASIVRNRALDHARRRELDTTTLARDGEADADLPADASTPIELLAAAADARNVRSCIDTLDAATRQAIALAFFQGMSHGELAAHLRQPLGTVKSWIRRGLARLRQCLDAVATPR